TARPKHKIARNSAYPVACSRDHGQVAASQSDGTPASRRICCSGSAPEPIFAAVIRLGDACARVAGFWTEKGDITRVPCIRATCFAGADEKSAYAHAPRCSAEVVNRCRVARQNLNTTLVAAP